MTYDYECQSCQPVLYLEILLLVLVRAHKHVGEYGVAGET
jgi:hypothetical protein